MRHNKKINKLGRTSSHRNAMMANMASSLIINKRIITTVAKAKALRTYVEPLITKSKNDTTHSRRLVFRKLQDKYAVTELFREVSDKVGDRPGGYTRILRTGNRLGDNAEMCIIELVDYNEAMLGSAVEEVKTKRRRSRRGGGAKKSDTTVTATAESTSTVEASESVSTKEVESEVITDTADDQDSVIEEEITAESETDETPAENEEEEKSEEKDE